MLAILTTLLILAVCYAFWREGLMTACCMFINVLLAGLIAFCFWEPIADQLDPVFAGSFLAGYEDCFVLVALFSLALGLLRLATNNLAWTMLDFHPALMQGGSVLFGVLTGYLIAGFLVCAFQTMPASENFMQLEYKIDAEGKGVRRFLPPDRVWLAMMHRAGAGPLSWGNGPTFDPHGNFALRYARYRRKDDTDKVRKDDGALQPR